MSCLCERVIVISVRVAHMCSGTFVQAFCTIVCNILLQQIHAKLLRDYVMQAAYAIQKVAL